MDTEQRDDDFDRMVKDIIQMRKAEDQASNRTFLWIVGIASTAIGLLWLCGG